VDLFFNIIVDPVAFPDEDADGETPLERTQISAEAKSIIGCLLNKDPNERLGKSVVDVKAHAFFTKAGVDWAAALIGEMEPPQRTLEVQAPTEQLQSLRWQAFEGFAAPPAEKDISQQTGVGSKLLSPVMRALKYKTKPSCSISATNPDSLQQRSASLSQAHCNVGLPPPAKAAASALILGAVKHVETVDGETLRRATILESC